MTYEFIIRDLRTKEDVWKVAKIPEIRYDSVKSSYEGALKRVKDKTPLSDFVLLINRCDDDGDFLEVVQ